MKRVSLKDSEGVYFREIDESSDLVIDCFHDVADGNIFRQPSRVFVTSQCRL